MNSAPSAHLMGAGSSPAAAQADSLLIEPSSTADIQDIKSSHKDQRTMIASPSAYSDDQSRNKESVAAANHDMHLITSLKTEYKSNFTPFDQYVYNEVTDSFVKQPHQRNTVANNLLIDSKSNAMSTSSSSHDIAAAHYEAHAQRATSDASPALEAGAFEPVNGSDANHQHDVTSEPWYMEVMKRNEKAHEYKFKSELGHNSALLKDNSLPDQELVRKSPLGNDPLIEAQILDKQQKLSSSSRFSPHECKRDHLISHMANNNNFKLPKDQGGSNTGTAPSTARRVMTTTTTSRPMSRTTASSRARSQSSKRQPVTTPAKHEPATKSNQSTPTKSVPHRETTTKAKAAPVTKTAATAGTTTHGVGRPATAAPTRRPVTSSVTSRVSTTKPTTAVANTTRTPAAASSSRMTSSKTSSPATKATTKPVTTPNTTQAQKSPVKRPTTSTSVSSNRPTTATRTTTSRYSGSTTSTKASKQPTSNTSSTSPVKSIKTKALVDAGEKVATTIANSTKNAEIVPDAKPEVSEPTVLVAPEQRETLQQPNVEDVHMSTQESADQNNLEPNLLFQTTEGGNMLADEIAQAEKVAKESMMQEQLEFVGKTVDLADTEPLDNEVLNQEKPQSQDYTESYDDRLNQKPGSSELINGLAGGLVSAEDRYESSERNVSLNYSAQQDDQSYAQHDQSPDHEPYSIMPMTYGDGDNKDDHDAFESNTVDDLRTMPDESNKDVAESVPSRNVTSEPGEEPVKDMTSERDLAPDMAESADDNNRHDNDTSSESSDGGHTTDKNDDVAASDLQNINTEQQSGHDNVNDDQHEPQDSNNSPFYDYQDQVRRSSVGANDISGDNQVDSNEKVSPDGALERGAGSDDQDSGLRDFTSSSGAKSAAGVEHEQNYDAKFMQTEDLSSSHQSATQEQHVGDSVGKPANVEAGDYFARTQEDPKIDDDFTGMQEGTKVDDDFAGLQRSTRTDDSAEKPESTKTDDDFMLGGTNEKMNDHETRVENSSHEQPTSTPTHEQSIIDQTKAEATQADRDMEDVAVSGSQHNQSPKDDRDIYTSAGNSGEEATVNPSSNENDSDCEFVVNKHELLMNVAELEAIETQKKQEMSRKSELARKQSNSSAPLSARNPSELLLSVDQLDEHIAQIPTHETHDELDQQGDQQNKDIDLVEAHRGETSQRVDLDSPKSSHAIDAQVVDDLAAQVNDVKLQASEEPNKYETVASSEAPGDLLNFGSISPTNDRADLVGSDAAQKEQEAATRSNQDKDTSKAFETFEVNRENSDKEESHSKSLRRESSSQSDGNFEMNLARQEDSVANLETDSNHATKSTASALDEDIDEDEQLKLSNHLTNSDDDVILEPRNRKDSFSEAFSPHRSISPSRYNEGAGLGMMVQEDEVGTVKLDDGSSAEIVAPTVAENRVEVSTSKSMMPELSSAATFIHPPKLTQGDDDDDNEDWNLDPSADPIGVAATMSPSSSVAEEMLRLSRQASLTNASAEFNAPSKAAAAPQTASTGTTENTPECADKSSELTKSQEETAALHHSLDDNTGLTRSGSSSSSSLSSRQHSNSHAELARSEIQIDDSSATTTKPINNNDIDKVNGRKQSIDINSDRNSSDVEQAEKKRDQESPSKGFGTKDEQAKVFDDQAKDVADGLLPANTE
jgi:hypothetical protein